MALKKGGFRTAAVEPRRHVGVAAAVAVGRCAALAEQRVKVAVHVAPRVAAGGVDGGEGGGGGDAPVTCGTRKTLRTIPCSSVPSLSWQMSVLGRFARIQRLFDPSLSW